VHQSLRSTITTDLLEEVLALVPDEWLGPDATRPDPKAPGDAAAARQSYLRYLTARLDASDHWLR
jgi:hypothetical protein